MIDTSLTKMVVSEKFENTFSNVMKLLCRFKQYQIDVCKTVKIKFAFSTLQISCCDFTNSLSNGCYMRFSIFGNSHFLQTIDRII